MILFLVTDLVSVRLVTRVKYAAAEGGFIGIFLNELYGGARLGVFPLQRERKFPTTKLF